MSFDFNFVSYSTRMLIEKTFNQFKHRAPADNLRCVAVNTVFQNRRDALMLVNKCLEFDKEVGVQAYAELAMQVVDHDHALAKNLVARAFSLCRALHMTNNFLHTVNAYILTQETTGQASYRSAL
jgi:hypothetical protein